jgi:uncharacterized protein (TIGR02271 family)
MPLFKIADFNPNYRQEAFDGQEVKGLDVYAGGNNEKIGTIDDVLVDQTGRFRYFVIDTGFWIFGKKVLLPVARCRVDVNAQRIYATGLTNKHQAEQLPEYNDNMTVDYDYEERVRGVYRTPAVETPLPVEASRSVETIPQPATPRPLSHQPRPAAYDRQTYTYDREPALYQMSDRDHQTLRLYEERLVTSKSRRKTGEVSVGKHVETQTASVSVPVEKERVVIERTTPDERTRINPGTVDFREGEVARMDVYEEDAQIAKQPFVREEVNIRKEVQQDTVDATETLRREELDVNAQGRSVIDRSERHPNSR